MPDEFVSLARYLRASRAPSAQTPVPEPAPPARTPEELEETLRAARRFRAGLADALDASLAQLLREIAREVLARELALRESDVVAIASAALERAGRSTVVTIRAHKAQVEALCVLGLPVVADDGLRCGDFAIDLKSGTIDMRVAARLEAAVERCLG